MTNPNRIHGGLNSKARFANGVDHTLHLRIARLDVTQEVGLEFGILALQQLLECMLLARGRAIVALLKIALQQLIELAQTPPTLPGQATQWRRSASSFLISPMALAGFRSLGQASVQFMIVWQRYSLNGSSRASSLSPVASSRLSMIQR